jgi:hypothetical protein
MVKDNILVAVLLVLEVNCDSCGGEERYKRSIVWYDLGVLP